MAKKIQPREVNIACRATRPGIPDFACPGNRALLFKIVSPRNAAGQRIAYYRCLTCNGIFSLSTG